MILEYSGKMEDCKWENGSHCPFYDVDDCYCNLATAMALPGSLLTYQNPGFKCPAKSIKIEVEI